MGAVEQAGENQTLAVWNCQNDLRHVSPRENRAAIVFKPADPDHERGDCKTGADCFLSVRDAQPDRTHCWLDKAATAGPMDLLDEGEYLALWSCHEPTEHRFGARLEMTARGSRSFSRHTEYIVPSDDTTLRMVAGHYTDATLIDLARWNGIDLDAPIPIPAYGHFTFRDDDLNAYQLTPKAGETVKSLAARMGVTPLEIVDDNPNLVGLDAPLSKGRALTISHQSGLNDYLYDVKSDGCSLSLDQDEAELGEGRYLAKWDCRHAAPKIRVRMSSYNKAHLTGETYFDQ